MRALFGGDHAARARIAERLAAMRLVEAGRAVHALVRDAVRVDHHALAEVLLAVRPARAHEARRVVGRGVLALGARVARVGAGLERDVRDAHAGTTGTSRGPSRAVWADVTRVARGRDGRVDRCARRALCPLRGPRVVVRARRARRALARSPWNTCRPGAAAPRSRPIFYFTYGRARVARDRPERAMNVPGAHSVHSSTIDESANV